MRSSNGPNYPGLLPAKGGVLLKRESLSEARYAQTLVLEARRCARKLVLEAEREADACRKHAARTGYHAGFAATVQLALEVVRSCKQIHLRLRDRMAAELDEALLRTLGDARLVKRLAEQLASRRREIDAIPPRVTLPCSARRIGRAVRSQVEQIWPGAQIEYADTDAFVVQWLDQVFEFAPTAAAQKLSAAALASCNDTLRSIDDEALIRMILEQALTRSSTDPDLHTAPSGGPVHAKETTT